MTHSHVTHTVFHHHASWNRAHPIGGPTPTTVALCCCLSHATANGVTDGSPRVSASAVASDRPPRPCQRHSPCSQHTAAPRRCAGRTRRPPPRRAAGCRGSTAYASYHRKRRSTCAGYYACLSLYGRNHAGSSLVRGRAGVRVNARAMARIRARARARARVMAGIRVRVWVRVRRRVRVRVRAAARAEREACRGGGGGEGARTVGAYTLLVGVRGQGQG
eukprot:scaffold48345_cov58-Phaeocystis_antarctica.AAC.2